MNTLNTDMPLAGPGLEKRPLNLDELGQAVHAAEQRIGTLSMVIREVVSMEPVDELAHRQLSAQRIAARQTLRVRRGELEDLKRQRPIVWESSPWIAG